MLVQRFKALSLHLVGCSWSLGCDPAVARKAEPGGGAVSRSVRRMAMTSRCCRRSKPSRFPARAPRVVLSSSGELEGRLRAPNGPVVVVGSRVRYLELRRSGTDASATDRAAGRRATFEQGGS
jgi:hypothetical protein